DVKRVTEIPGVLAESFSVVATENEKRVFVSPELLHSFYQLSQSLISVVQRIEIAPHVRLLRKWSGLWRQIGMMASGRQIGKEERFVRRQVFHPFEHSLHSSRFFGSEAGLTLTADCAGIAQLFVAAIVNHVLHAEIHETA